MLRRGMTVGRPCARTFASMVTTAAKLKALEAYNACDISDALLKLKIPGAGFVPDMTLRTPGAARRVYAPASTVLFAPKAHDDDDEYADEGPNIPADAHYVDLTPPRPGRIVVMAQPAGQRCAVLGGIMALRMARRGAAGIVVAGRVRDLGELDKIGAPVWSRATSTVGAGAETKPWALDVPVDVGGVAVVPGDIVCADPGEAGVVVIPAGLLDKVLELCPKLTAADDKVLEDVAAGGTVQDAFKKHRG